MTNEMRVYLNNVDLDPLTTIVNGVETEVVLYPSDMENPWIFERINGEYTFAFVIRNEGLGKIIHNDHVVFVDDDYFIIVGEDILHGEAYEKKYTCEHISYLLNFHNEDSDELESEITYSGSIYSILPTMLIGTRFDYTPSDNTPGNFTFTTKKRGVRARIIEFCTQHGFEANFYRFYVTLQNRRGYADGPEIRFGKNIRRLRESRILNFDKTEDVNFDLDYVDLNYVTDLDGNMLSDNDLHMGDTVYIYTTLDEDEVPVVKRAVAVGYNPFEHALPTVELSDNLMARDLAQQMMTKGDNSGSGDNGLVINGTTERLVTYKETIEKGDLVTIKRTFDLDTLVKLNNPDALPTGDGNATSFTADGKYLAVGHATTPFLSLYKRNGNTLTKLPNPDVLPAGIVNGVNFTDDGEFLAVAHSSSPYITIYKRIDDVFTKLPNPSVLPNLNAHSVKFSMDKKYLAVGHSNGNYMRMYRRDGNSFVNIELPIYTNQIAHGLDFSQDGKYFVAGCNSAPYIRIYSIIDGVFTNIGGQTIIFPNNVRALKFTPDGKYLIIASSSVGVKFFENNEGILSPLPDPLVTSPQRCYGVDITSDGNIVMISHNDTPYTTMYRIENDTLVKLDAPDIIPTGNGRGVSFAKSEPYVSVAHVNAPYVTNYRYDIAGEYGYNFNGPSDIYKTNFYALAVAVDNGTVDQTGKKVVTIPLS